MKFAPYLAIYFVFVYLKFHCLSVVRTGIYEYFQWVLRLVGKLTWLRMNSSFVSSARRLSPRMITSGIDFSHLVLRHHPTKKSSCHWIQESKHYAKSYCYTILKQQIFQH
uniref:Putative secreted protein n=1 Tax=Xenopsylla cheopis TaxID=163159 RepID=A0A6M2DUM4_XENCH